MRPPSSGYMQLTETVVLALFGIILWAATHRNSPITDTVTLYTLRTDAPDFKAFEEISTDNVNKITAATISLHAWYKINSTCMNPDAIQSLALTDPTFMSSANFPTVPVSPANPGILPKLLYTPHLITSPLCRCLATTLINVQHEKSRWTRHSSRRKKGGRGLQGVL